MRRTPIGARKFVSRSGIPYPAWARRLGISVSSFHSLVNGESRMQKGPAMARLITLLHALDNNEWRWIRTGPIKLSASWSWEGEAVELQPKRPAMTINVLEGRIGWQP